MRLYFGGCSATHGDELKNPETEAWPVLVAKHFGSQYANHGRPGGSNDLIWKDVIVNLNDYDKFYVQWTHITRFAVRNPDTQNYLAFNPQLQWGQYSNKEHYQTFAKYYYAYWYNSAEKYLDLLTYIISLQDVFKSNNKEYVMLFANPGALLPFDLGFKEIDPHWFKQVIPPAHDLSGNELSWFHDEMPEKLNQLIRRVDKSRFVYDGTFNFIEGSPEFGIHPPELPSRHKDWHEDGGHGSAKAHKEHAKIIVEWEEKQKGKQNESN